jgi:hypothetical protein
MPHRMLKKAAVLTRAAPASISPALPPIASQSLSRDAPLRRQGRSERRGDAYSVRYVGPLSEVRSPLADFFSILLGRRIPQEREPNKAKLLVPRLNIG